MVKELLSLYYQEQNEDIHSHNTSIPQGTEGAGCRTKATERNERHPDWREKGKLLTNNMIICRKWHEIFKKLLELVGKFGKERCRT